MIKDDFKCVRCCIHFVDNDKSKTRSDPMFDPLFKGCGIMVMIVAAIQKGWTADKISTIDESMIKYMGRVVTFVQYIPAKPIKHRIKVFACCCAQTGVLLSFKVYLGKENGNLASTAPDIVERIIRSANFVPHNGRII